MNKNIANIILLSMLTAAQLCAGDDDLLPQPDSVASQSNSTQEENVSDRNSFLSQIQRFSASALKKVPKSNNTLSDSFQITRKQVPLKTSDEIESAPGTPLSTTSEALQPPSYVRQFRAASIPQFDPSKVSLKRSASASSKFIQDINVAQQAPSQEPVKPKNPPSYSDKWPHRTGAYNWSIGRHEALKYYNSISDENIQGEYLVTYGQRKGQDALADLRKEIENEKKRKEKAASSAGTVVGNTTVVMLSPLKITEGITPSQIRRREAAEASSNPTDKDKKSVRLSNQPAQEILLDLLGFRDGKFPVLNNSEILSREAAINVLKHISKTTSSLGSLPAETFEDELCKAYKTTINLAKTIEQKYHIRMGFFYIAYFSHCENCADLLDKVFLHDKWNHRNSEWFTFVTEKMIEAVLKDIKAGKI